MKRIIRLGCAAALALGALGVQAESRASAGSSMLEFWVIGGCPTERPLRSVTLHLPFGVLLERAVPQAGWEIAAVQQAVQKNGPLGRAASVDWVRTDSGRAGSDEVRFKLEGRLPDGLEKMSVNLRHQCTDGPPVNGKVLLRAQAPSPAPVEVSDAWMRTPSTAARRDTAAFMTFKATRSVRLVHAFSPSAKRIAIEGTLQSKLRGMEMFPVSDIELPAGSTVRLVPGLVHLAVYGLDNDLGEGAAVPLTLRFKDGAGIITERALMLRLSSNPPGYAAPRNDNAK